MVGVGDPLALHFNVTLDPSRTITSLELKESSMFGGTERKEKFNYEKYSEQIKLNTNYRDCL